jgi:hypothetical protein
MNISEKSSIGPWRLKRTQRLGLVSSFLLGLEPGPFISSCGMRVGDPSA